MRTRISAPIVLVLSLLALLASPLAAQLKPLKSLPLSRSPGFAVDYYQGFKLVTVKNPWPGAAKPFRYVLYPRGQAKPAPAVLKTLGVENAKAIEIPLRRVVTFSTSYLPAIVALGRAGTVVGVDATAYVNSPEIRARIASGEVVETTKNWMPDVERMIALAPDAVFTYGMGNEWDSHPKLVEAGLPVIINGEWNEAEPLARAEWIKFIAAFYDEEAKAEAYFAQVERNYASVKAAVAAAGGPKPKVLVNGPFQGSWHVSAGQSYMARYIADAGGDYLWGDRPGTGGLSLSVEAVFERALLADVWIGPGLMPTTIAEILAMDPRFAALPVVKKGAVWNNNLRMNEFGGNDYFESAVLNPDKVLADLAKIFRPGILADRPFTYHRPLAK